MATDIVYFVRAGETNEELRHSIRSVAQNLPHGNIWIIGFRPTWLTGVRHVSFHQNGASKHTNVFNMWKSLGTNDDLPDRFILMNDDFFVMQPMEEVPVLHQGDLTKYSHRRLGSTYLQRAVRTADALVKLGRVRSELLAYELHIPFPVTRSLITPAMDALASVATSPLVLYNKRTWYGNFARIGGTGPQMDCKISSDEAWAKFGGSKAINDWPWLSTADATMRYGRVGKYIKGRFPTPCRYEDPVRRSRV